jgi:predicted nucleic acid-binding protein
VRIALDTNLLAYAEGINGAEKRDIILNLLVALPQDSIAIPVQALGELYHALVRRARRSRIDARNAILAWRDGFPLIETSEAAMLSAADLAADHQFSIWDAFMLAAAAEAGCRLLLSEDMQDGFTWRGVSVANPFAVSRHPLLEAALAAAR